jgi:hypothetical protein
VQGYVTPANASPAVVDTTKTYRYRAQSADMSQWEQGNTVSSGSATSFTRVVTSSSAGGTTLVNFTNPPNVLLTFMVADLLLFDDAMALTAAQQNQASVNLGQIRAIRTQKFTATGTYTPNANLIYAIIECWGAGGGGGGVAGTASQTKVAGGGGGGSYSRTVSSAATIGASKAVTIGAAGTGGLAGANNGVAGGDTSVTTLCVGKGGSGGLAGAFSAPPGVPGVAGTGDVTTLGMSGTSAGGDVGASMSIAVGGGGGNSTVGAAGGGGVANNTAIAGFNAGAGGFAAGGGGASSNNSTLTAAGGNASPGLCVITEFCSQ